MRKRAPPPTKEDPATVVGPYDFREKDFKENVGLMDYATLGYVFSTLPPVVLASVAYQSLRLMRSTSRKSLKEAAWERAMFHVAENCDWPQLRRLCPVRPLREELRLLNWRTKPPGYNHYFGGHDFSARWLVEKPGRQPSDPVMLYMHGGSYALKVQKPQVKYLLNLVQELRPVEISILIIDYTIGPFAKHPTQLDEGMACYKELRKSCDNIIFFGDSCGGHMALSMLLSGASCEGLYLISPSTDMTSGMREDTDMREVFVDSTRHSYDDPLVSPLYADASRWSTLIPEYTAVVWGENEESKQQMIDWAKVANVSASFEEPEGSHDCILRGNSNAGSKFIRHELQMMLLATTGIQSAPSESSTSRSRLSTPASLVSSSTSLESIIKLDKSIEIPIPQAEPQLRSPAIKDQSVARVMKSGMSSIALTGSLNEPVLGPELFFDARSIA